MEACLSTNGCKNIVVNFIMCPYTLVVMGPSQKVNAHWIMNALGAHTSRKACNLIMGSSKCHEESWKR